MKKLRNIIWGLVLIGLGSIKIDGKDISNGEIFGNGENYIEVDGGVGNIKIDFAV